MIVFHRSEDKHHSRLTLGGIGTEIINGGGATGNRTASTQTSTSINRFQIVAKRSSAH